MPTEIPARILRADVIAREPSLNDRNQREQQQYERILTHAPPLFASYGRGAISFTNFAIALKMSPVTLRKHFADLDALLAHLLVTHLLAIAQAIGKAPGSGRAAARAAYLQATRAPFGGLTEAHGLFITEYRNLPPDLRDEVETLHRQLGEICAGPLADQVLPLLDGPCYSASQIECLLAALGEVPVAQHKPAQAEPAAKPQFTCRGMHEAQDDMTAISGVTIPLGALAHAPPDEPGFVPGNRTLAHHPAGGLEAAL
jgi:AcrR family transcriptional regulator